VADALAIRAAFAASPADAVPLPAGPGQDAEVIRARLLGGIIGMFAGFFAGGFTGGVLAILIFFHADHDPNGGLSLSFALTLIVFFGGAFGGAILGAVLGRKLLSPLFEGTVRRRQRWLARNTERYRGQPPSSAAVVEERVNELLITLPPVGLVRGLGCFVFVWGLLWNLFLLIATPAFVWAAFHGEMKGGDGQPAQPAFIILFLVPFWAVGVGAALAIFYHGRRRAQLRVSAEGLAALEQTIFGNRHQECSRDRITDVKLLTLGPGQARLVISSPGQADTPILKGRTPDELAWLAKILRQQLALTHHSPEPAD
jgi:hypothetical protein